MFALIDQVHLRHDRPVVNLLETSHGPTRMPDPAFVVLWQREGLSSYYLDRYTADGQKVGDTWHESLPVALEFAADEFGTALGQWTDAGSKNEAIGFAKASLAAK